MTPSSKKGLGFCSQARIRVPTSPNTGGFMRAILAFVLLMGSIGAHAESREEISSKVLDSIGVIVVATPTGNRAEDNVTSIGTGFCIWSTPVQSYFLTNYHVIADAVRTGGAKVLVRPNFFASSPDPELQKRFFWAILVSVSLIIWSEHTNCSESVALPVAVREVRVQAILAELTTI